MLHVAQQRVRARRWHHHAPVGDCRRTKARRWHRAAVDLPPQRRIAPVGAHEQVRLHVGASAACGELDGHGGGVAHVAIGGHRVAPFDCAPTRALHLRVHLVPARAHAGTAGEALSRHVGQRKQLLAGHGVCSPPTRWCADGSHRRGECSIRCAQRRHAIVVDAQVQPRRQL